MSHKVTSTCKTCKSEFSYEYGGRGARRKYCGDGCSRSNPMCEMKAKCVECGAGFTYWARPTSLRVRKYCGELCGSKSRRKAAPSQNWKTMTPEQKAGRSASDKRYRQRRQAAKVAQMKADGTYRYCSNCGGDMPQRKGRIYCAKGECREAYRHHHNERSKEMMRRIAAEHKERTGESYYAKYKDRPYNKNYNYRERHPDRAKHYDHVRRARMANCERESFSDSEIFERDGFMCGICGESVDMEVRYPDAMSASLDHIIPLSRGGGHVRSNVRLAHMGCNARKNARLDEEFITAS